MVENPNDWTWAKYVVSEIERNAKESESNRDKIDTIHERLARMETELKLKAGIWGTIGALVVILVTVVIGLVGWIIKGGLG